MHVRQPLNIRRALARCSPCSRALSLSSAHRLPLSASPAVQSNASHAQSTVNADEIAHFSRLSSLWWDERGEFGQLHKMNPVRMQFVREKVIETVREDGDERPIVESKVLDGLSVLDVGCGGGLLSESLARLGANTLGIDASSSNIAIASLHASADPALASLKYQHTSSETLLADRGSAQFDVVCALEVLEHVDNPRAFLSSCAELVKPGGHLFLSTIARTPLAYLLTILAAENVLRLVAPGTHTYSKYVNPDELLDFFHQYRSPVAASPSSSASPPWISRLYGRHPTRTEAETRGMIYLPWQGKWLLVPRDAPYASQWSEGCNYLFWVRRPKE